MSFPHLADSSPSRGMMFQPNETPLGQSFDLPYASCLISTSEPQAPAGLSIENPAPRPSVDDAFNFQIVVFQVSSLQIFTRTNDHNIFVQ